MRLPLAPVGDIHWAGTETALDHPCYIDVANESGTRAAQEVLTQRDHLVPR
ncbi:FAD-dependent oxidoreductase [Nocardia sp. NPDC003693]